MTEFVTIEDHLYARKGKRVTSYFTVVQGKYKPLGRDLEKARKKRDELQGFVVDANTIEAMCEAYLKDQDERREAGDATALSERTVRQYGPVKNFVFRA